VDPAAGDENSYPEDNPIPDDTDAEQGEIEWNETGGVVSPGNHSNASTVAVPQYTVRLP